MKTHEAEYANSTASLALYQRALAVLGQQTPPPQQQQAAASPAGSGEIEFNEELDEEEMEEEEERVDEDERLSLSPGAPANGEAQGSPSRRNSSASGSPKSNMEFAKQLTVAV